MYLHHGMTSKALWSGQGSAQGALVKEQQRPKRFGTLKRAKKALWKAHQRLCSWHEGLEKQSTIVSPDIEMGETIPTPFFPLWAEEVASQYGELDGVKDSIISNPHLCSPDTSTVVCSAANASACVSSTTCLTEGQKTTLSQDGKYNGGEVNNATSY
ncbi:hypothetical protein RSAG8_06254, partial [Rhizoctonia solani AG-8 WAC10335]